MKMDKIKKLFGIGKKENVENEISHAPGSIDESFRIDENSGSSPTAIEESEGVSDPEVPGLGISESEVEN